MAIGWKGSYTRYKEFFLNIAELYKKKADLRAFLEIILSLFTIIIFLLFALKPTVITIVDLLQQIKQKESTLATLTQKVSDLQKAAGLLQQNQTFIPNVNIAVSSLAKPNVLAEQVLGISAKNSVDIIGFSIDQLDLVGVSTNRRSPDSKPLPGDAKEMPFSISVRGTYLNLNAFITDLEKMRIMIKVDSYTINSSTTDNGLVIVAVVSGRVPFLEN